MIEHTARAYDAELRELADRIGEMGRLDKEQITDALEALLKRDIVLAKRVIATDDRVDSLQREIVGALRISNDLERIGDLAENVAKRVVLLTEEFRINDVALQLQRMVQLVLDQLMRVLESYDRRDVAEALEVWRKDQEIDALNNSLFRELLTYMMENPRNITFCTHLLFCAKNIERMGDHATNIAETVYYIVQGRPLLDERPKADLTSQQMLPLPA